MKADSEQLIAVEVVEDSQHLNLYEKREKIFTRKIEGFYQIVRAFTGWPLLLGYFLTPWLTVNGHQAILFDLPERQFHIFWLTFWPQDFSLLAATLIISAFTLFFVTNLVGRVWCGYTCPQTVWTAIYMWAEQVTEGSRNERIRLEAAPWSVSKLYKRALKHAMWIGFALLTGATFIGYFYGIKNLVVDAYRFELPHEAVFWTMFFTLATYLNAGWMREQVCKYMCPYARFQSAMFDKNTLIVSYDEHRGEQRGARKKSIDPLDIGLGDCIDCTWCVQVCPTGIDIRDGLQYECINCAACIDACNNIMDKMGYERGLIRYTTENQLDGKGWTWKRPRLLGYGVAILIMMTLFAVTLFNRQPLEIDVLRGRGQLYQEVPGGYVQNTYTVKAINKSLESERFQVRVEGLPNLHWEPTAAFEISGAEVLDVSLTVRLDADDLPAVNNKIMVHLERLRDGATDKTESRFIGPRSTP